MLSPEIKQRLKDERTSLKAWLSGDARDRFILKRHDQDYDVCAVLFYPLWKHIFLSWRYVLGCLARWSSISAVKVMFYRMMGVTIGRNVYIAPDVMLDVFYPELITLEDNCFLGIGCRILAHGYTANDFRLGRVRVGRGSVVGAYATVLCGISIGGKCTIGASSLVNRNIPDDTTVGGVPARPLAKSEAS